MKKTTLRLVTIVLIGSNAPASTSVTVNISDGGVYSHKLRRIEGSIVNATNKAKLAIFNECGINGIEENIKILESKCYKKKRSHRKKIVNVCEVQASASCSESNSEIIASIGKDGGTSSYKNSIKNGNIYVSYGKAYSHLVRQCEEQGKVLNDLSVEKKFSFCSKEILGSKARVVNICKTGLKATCR